MITITLMGGLLYQVDWWELLYKIQTFSLSTLGLGIGLLGLSQTLTARRWQVVSRPFFPHIKFGRFWQLYMAGLCLGLVLPTAVGGDVGKAYGLGGSPQEKGLAAWTVLVDRYSGLMVQLALAILGWVALATPALRELTGGLVTVLAAGIYGSWAILPLVLHRLEDRWPQIQQLRQYWDPRLISEVGGYALAIHVINCGIHVLIGHSLGITLSPGSYMLIYCLAAIASVLPISLGGLGVREGTYVYLLGKTGIDATTSTTFAGLWFVTLLLVSLSGSLAIWSLWQSKSNHSTPPPAKD
ncbi:MAG: lysylphosphatidylglycerol synthase transmembrane domain-containing protein [Cyanobacteriota bacterium]|nr:lysylphosphatidylglycerol synthase transmembrane domain-containing protein [Cyanobacteriota bacterium]